MHNWLDTILEAYIAYILTMEYFYGRSDTDIKREEKRRKTKAEKRVGSAQISYPSGEKDVAVGPSAQAGIKQGDAHKGSLEVREMPEASNESLVHNPKGPQSPTN